MQGEITSRHPLLTELRGETLTSSDHGRFGKERQEAALHKDPHRTLPGESLRGDMSVHPQLTATCRTEPQNIQKRSLGKNVVETFT